ncbi:MAG TPA: hypothetical protein VF909_20230 [Roseiflexaceae bacterium]
MTTSIGFDPALPCCTIQGDTICGKAATAGTLYPMGSSNYILLLFCRECTQALLAVYGPPGELGGPAAGETQDVASVAEQTAVRAIGLAKRRAVSELSDDTIEAIFDDLADMHEERNPGGFS